MILERSRILHKGLEAKEQSSKIRGSSHNSAVGLILTNLKFATISGEK